MWRNRLTIRSSRSRSISTQRPRMRASPSVPARIAFTSARDSFSPSRVTSTLKSSSASVPSADGGRVPTVAVTCGRGGRPARHAVGTRTTIAGTLQLRDVAEEADGLPR